MFNLWPRFSMKRDLLCVRFLALVVELIGDVLPCKIP